MIELDDKDAADRAALDYQLKIDKDPTLIGKWKVDVGGPDPITGKFTLVAHPLWDHGWTLPELLNIPFPSKRRKK